MTFVLMIYKLVTFRMSFISVVRLLFLDGLKCKSTYKSQKIESSLVLRF